MAKKAPIIEFDENGQAPPTCVYHPDFGDRLAKIEIKLDLIMKGLLICLPILFSLLVIVIQLMVRDNFKPIMLAIIGGAP